MLPEQDPTGGKNQVNRWLAALDAYGVQYVILDTRRDGELARTVQSNPSWTVDFQEGTSILFARARAHVGALVEV